MKFKMYSVRDSKAMTYTNPQFVMNEQVMVRTFTNIINEKGHPMNLNPEDFYLYEMGEFDNESGDFTLLDEPKCVTNGISVLVNNEQPIQGV